jgi:ferredoxin
MAGREDDCMRVRIDREKCVSAGNCVVTAPTVFLLDSENKARLIDAGSVDEDVLFLAAEMCPTEAIVLESDDGEQMYP